MANFKCKQGIYNLDYQGFQSPLIWWQFIDNDNNHNLLRKIALKLFAIVPHSASCERNFSSLGWFYEKYRQNLNLTTVESMSKIRHFYLTYSHSELQYSGKNFSEEEISDILKESNLFNQDDELEEEDQNDNNLEIEIVEEDQIPQHEVYVLIMAKDINLNNPVFNDDEMEDNLENESDIGDKEELEDKEEENEEFDINEIIDNTSFDFD